MLNPTVQKRTRYNECAHNYKHTISLYIQAIGWISKKPPTCCNNEYYYQNAFTLFSYIGGKRSHILGCINGCIISDN